MLDVDLTLDTLIAVVGLEALDVVEQMYVPDLLAVASFYKDWAGYGAGVGNYLVYGEYPDTDGPNAPLFLPSGVIRNKDLSVVEPLDQSMITEYITHSWFDYDGGDDQPLHPFDGETNPNYTGPEPPYERLDTSKKYSWLKSPRYEGVPMEVGPLSRMLVNYVRGHEQVQGLVNHVLKKALREFYDSLGDAGAMIIKAVAGGGGRGMRRVETPEDLPESLDAAMREADSAFGDPTVFMEEFLPAARHVEAARDAAAGNGNPEGIVAVLLANMASELQN